MFLQCKYGTKQYNCKHLWIYMNLQHTEPSSGLPCHWTWGYVQSQRLKFAGSVDTGHGILNLQNLRKILMESHGIMDESWCVPFWFSACIGLQQRTCSTPRLQQRCSQVEAFPTQTFSHSVPEKWRSSYELHLLLVTSCLCQFNAKLICPEPCRGTMRNMCRTFEVTKCKSNFLLHVWWHASFTQTHLAAAMPLPAVWWMQ